VSQTGKFFQDIKADVECVQRRHQTSALQVVISNRGFHALLNYRISFFLSKKGLGFISMVLTRLVQIIYSIDIDYRAELEGGIIITHGVGAVIGESARVGCGTEIYHGVTLGIRGHGADDNSPSVGRNCTLGTGCKLLGPITVGGGSVIGANVVLTHSVPENSLVKMPAPTVQQMRSRKC